VCGRRSIEVVVFGAECSLGKQREGKASEIREEEVARASEVNERTNDLEANEC